MFDLRKSLLVGIGPPFDIFDDTQRINLNSNALCYKMKDAVELKRCKNQILLEGLTLDGTKFSVGNADDVTWKPVIHSIRGPLVTHPVRRKEAVRNAWAVVTHFNWIY